MKKIFLLTTVLMLAVAYSQAQTYYYKHIETVDSNTGVRSKGSGIGMYITFSGNYCYLSDENGYIKKDEGVEKKFVCVSNTGGVVVFRYTPPPPPSSNGFTPYFRIDGTETTLRFSNNYERVNSQLKGGNDILVWVRSKSPKELNEDGIIY